MTSQQAQQILDTLKDMFLHPDFIPIVLFLLGLLLFSLKFFKVDLTDKVVRTGATFVKKVQVWDKSKARQHEQLSKIGVTRNRYYRVYRVLISGVIESYGIRLSVENFNTIFATITALIFVGVLWNTSSIFLAFLISIPSIIGIVVAIIVGSKSRIRVLNNYTMEFLDSVCPLMYKGLLVALEQSITAAHPNIRPHIIDFMNRVKMSIPLNVALDDLSEKLGIRFYEFARKAYVFEQDPTRDMAESFQDITEVNKQFRIDALKAEYEYSKINFDMYGRIAIIVMVTLYANFYGITADFMRHNFLGQLTNAITLLCCIIIYGTVQMMQVGINISEELKKEEKL